MRKLLTTMMCYFFFSLAFSQLSLNIGGGINTTMDNIRGFHKSDNDLNQLSITPDVGGFGELGCSYMFKKRYLLRASINFAYQEYNTTTKIPYTTYYGEKTWNYDNFYDFFYSVSLPITCGYVIEKEAQNFSFIPQVGWVNQILSNSNQFNIKSAYPGKYYMGYIFVGFTLKIKFFYLNCNYSYSITKYPVLYSRVRLQTINLSLGYVYTFKTKAERQAKK